MEHSIGKQAVRDNGERVSLGAESEETTGFSGSAAAAVGHKRDVSTQATWYGAVPAAWYREQVQQRAEQVEAMPISKLIDTQRPQLLRTGLVEYEDFILVPESEFKQLVSSYGADAPLPNLLPVMSNGIIEVRPLRVLIDGEERFVSQEADIGSLHRGPLYMADSREPLPTTGTVRDAMITDNTELYTSEESVRGARVRKLSTETSAIAATRATGLVGLNNLGNTCFMNSAIQCLASTVPLTEYFLSGEYRKDLNRTNPLGTGGVLAEEFAALVRQLWSTSQGTVAPRRFKYQVSRYAPQFSGYGQHDAQEWITFLLDGLHEDLNRVRRKPYISLDPDQDMLPDEAWKYHKARNDSVIVDLFHGQYRSRVQCPECDKISITHDPFMYLSLPLPSRRERFVTIRVWTLNDMHRRQPPQGWDLCIPRRANIRILKERLQQVTGLDADELAIVDCAPSVQSMGVSCLVSPRRRIDKPGEIEELAAIQVEDPDALMLLEGRNARSQSGSKGLLGAIPEAVRVTTCVNGNSLPAEAQLVEVHQLGPGREPVGIPLIFTLPRDDLDESHLHAAISERLGGVREHPTPEAYTLRPRMHAPGHTISYELEWHEAKDAAEVSRFLRSPSMHETNGANSRHSNGVLDLHQCLHLWSETEQLDDENLWYCPRCKKHQRAWKQLSLYRAPPILIIHLKRFQYTSWFRDKIDVSVEFPLRGLALDFAGTLVNYDLYAVSHHMGSLGSGHYTASCYRASCSRWFYFDDAYVSALPEDEDEVAKRIVSPSAYILFYQRRIGTEIPNGHPNAATETLP
jgi:ubiquitin carboxyl-terminal hydrolase 4/11/15